MSYPILMVPAGDVIPILFATYAGATGASITMTGLAVTDIKVYKDGSVAQRASEAGYTLLETDGIDFDALTGIHGFSINTGDNTDAGFYTVGAWFTVVVSAVTVDGQTVNFIAAMFRLMAAESVAAEPKVDVDAWLGTAAATPTVAGVPEVDVTHWNGTAIPGVDTAGYPKVTIKDGTGTGELDTASGVVLAKDHTGAALATATALDAVDNFVDTEVADIQSRLPAALVGGRMDASVGAVAAAAITAAAIATDAIDADALAADALTEIADAVHDEVVEGSLTFRVLTRLMAAALMGEISGAEGTTVVIRDASDTKTRITATVTSDGNRTTLTLDGS